MKPQDLFIGVIDIFAVFLPGMIFTGYLSTYKDIRNFAKLLVPANDSTAYWILFLLSSYFIGHIFFLIAAHFDDTCDKETIPKLYRDAKDAARKLAETARQSHASSSTDTLPTDETDRGKEMFRWAKSVLTQFSPAAMNEVARYEADSKFFRSTCLVAIILAIALFFQFLIMVTKTSLSLSWPYLFSAITSAALSILSWLRYAERRAKSSEWAFRHVAVWCEHQKKG
jgi:hypothetical protein